MITDYRKTIDDAVYYNPKTDGDVFVKGTHCVLTWDTGELFKAYFADDGRYFDSFEIPGLTPERAKEVAEEYAAEFDLACDEETDND